MNPTALIDARIAELNNRRGETLARVRAAVAVNAARPARRARAAA